MHGGHQQLSAHHELVAQVLLVHHGVVGEDKHHVTGQRPAELLGFLHQLLPVEVPGLEHDGHVEEVEEGLRVVVELPVL